MATSPEDLVDRFEERSLAAIPPVPQQVRGAERHPYRLWVPAEPSGASGGTRWHHAAPFACVEWTNLWFEHDIVGGPIGPHFGPGVSDVSLGGLKWMAGFAFAYPHSSYWTTSRRALVREGSMTSLRLLREKVRRRPTLLLTTRAPLTEEVGGRSPACCWAATAVGRWSTSGCTSAPRTPSGRGRSCRSASLRCPRSTPHT